MTPAEQVVAILNGWQLPLQIGGLLVAFTLGLASVKAVA